MKLTLSIEGKKAVGLMDSGANCSLLSENWYLGNLKPKGVTLYNTSDYICDLSGNEINIIGHVVVDVEVSGMEQNSCVFYVKRAEKGRNGLGKNTNQECLVGMNVLSLLFEKWGVTKNVNVMALEKEGLKAEYSPVLDCCMRLVGQTMQVWQKEDIGYASCLRQQNRNVPSGSRKLIKVYIDSLKEVPKEYVVLEKIADESKNMLPPGVQVLPSFSICEWGVGYVCVANWSKDNVSIEAGSILATVQLGIREFMEDDDNENIEKLSETELQNHRRKLGVNVDESNLSKSDLVRLDKILYKYKNCFELNDSDLGLIKGWEHSIRLSCGKPIKLPYRRIAPTLIPEAKQLLDDLKKRGVIEESASPYAAPIVLVRKKGGGLRLCIDYRKLNEKTFKDAFPLPRVAECLDSLEGAKYFSTLDLAQGYHQVLLRKEDREKTAFSVPWGHFQYRRCPMAHGNCGDRFLFVERSTSGKEHILVLSDLFSKYVWAYPTKDQKATTVAKILVEELFYKYGIPQQLHTDQGRNFESALIKEICKRFNVKKSRTSPYHPEGNGQVERMNRTLYGLLRSLEEEKRNKWPLYLQSLVFAYDITPHSVTVFSPYFLLFGREPCISIESWGYLEDIYKFQDGDWLGQQCKMQKEVWDLVRRNTQKNWVSKAKPMLAKSRESDLEPLKGARQPQLGAGVPVSNYTLQILRPGSLKPDSHYRGVT
ncbi:uncharacterized protein [Palaemon carinicauda]|uniref:uncharacterized protein n=1 Tax=Palaemon carinicauda TaxID=392227 RepID=UPI0035B5C5C6